MGIITFPLPRFTGSLNSIITLSLDFYDYFSLRFKKYIDMSSVPPIQELPPPGGYEKIVYQRVLPKRYMTGFKILGLFVGLHFIALYYYYSTVRPRDRARKLEQASSKLALQPFLMAERDRMHLKRGRQNMEYETELMKDVKGWEVGKWYDEPIYVTRPADEFNYAMDHELNAFTDGKDDHRRMTYLH